MRSKSNKMLRPTVNRTSGLAVLLGMMLLMGGCSKSDKPDEQSKLDKHFMDIGNESVLGTPDRIAEAEKPMPAAFRRR